MQTPDLSQNSPSPERKELPLQPPKEGIPEKQGEVVVAGAQADPHTEEQAAGSGGEGDEESLDEDEKQGEKEITPARSEADLGDVASSDSKKKTEEGFETVSL